MGADVDMKSPCDWQPPLHVATKEGREGVVRILPDNSADINITDGRYKKTPLHVEAEGGCNEIITLPLENGTGYLWDWTPLLTTIWEDSESAVKLLLEKGADINSMNAHGQTRLRMAAEHNDHASITRLLVERGACLEVDRIYDTYTMLTWASEAGDEVLVRLLLDHGARIESRGNEGQTAPSRAYTQARGMMLLSIFRFRQALGEGLDSDK